MIWLGGARVGTATEHETWTHDGVHLVRDEQLLFLRGDTAVKLTTTIDIDASGISRGDLRAQDIETAPYPGLATDLQPPTCVLLTQANGTSHVREAIFEDRIEGLAELRKLGAKIDILDAHRAAIHGPARLHGGEATIGDLRAGATLILAALAADGSSLIHGAHHVQRGYENIDRKFQQLGASIVRSADPA
jgi:UDP-N-acetylglucosamine 1-carboxyvinyltransferase